jgi:hypothetical protein
VWAFERLQSVNLLSPKFRLFGFLMHQVVGFPTSAGLVALYRLSAYEARKNLNVLCCFDLPVFWSLYIE